MSPHGFLLYLNLKSCLEELKLLRRKHINRLKKWNFRGILKVMLSYNGLNCILYIFNLSFFSCFPRNDDIIH